MSMPPSARQLPQSRRKKRPVEEVSFEDLLAAHRTEREPGQLPREGVVLIGVDVELQRRMAERVPFPAPVPGEDSKSDAPNIGAQEETRSSTPAPAQAIHSNLGAPNFAAPDNGASRVGASIQDAPAIGAPIGGAPINEGDLLEPSATVSFGAPKTDAPKLDTSNIGAAILVAPNFSAPIVSAPNFKLTDLLGRPSGPKQYVVHPIARLEDVFTPAERDLLRWLWEKGRPIPAAETIRLVTGPNGEGARRLAVQAGLIYNTFKNLSRSLSTKLAVDIVKPEKNQPAVYVVYYADAILRRQREAGFTGVLHKNGGGRELVSGASEPAPRRPDLTLSELEQFLVQCTKL